MHIRDHKDWIYEPVLEFLSPVDGIRRYSNPKICHFTLKFLQNFYINGQIVYVLSERKFCRLSNGTFEFFVPTLVVEIFAFFKVTGIFVFVYDLRL